MLPGAVSPSSSKREQAQSLRQLGLLEEPLGRKLVGILPELFVAGQALEMNHHGALLRDVIPCKLGGLNRGVGSTYVHWGMLSQSFFDDGIQLSEDPLLDPGILDNVGHRPLYAVGCCVGAGDEELPHQNSQVEIAELSGALLLE